MPTPPRYLVLTAADQIVRDGLAGDTDDTTLAWLARVYRARESQRAAEAKVRDQWTKIRLSPFFKLYVFYAVMILASYVLPILQKKLAERKSRRR